MSKRKTNLDKTIINKGHFWQSMSKPFFVLAPMANVTDFAFRKMIAKYGRPDVMWTEFVSADGLMSAGQKKLLIDLKYSKSEKPIVAQLFTGRPEVMKSAATLVAKLGFDGLDINMGCPDRKVEKSGGGASLMKNQKLAIEILNSAREGVLNYRKSNSIKSKKNVVAIPISVKTRIGYSKFDLEWIKLLLEQRLPALTIHLRTRKEMSDVPAHWELMGDIVEIKNQISPETLIIGNGDIESVAQGLEMIKKYGCDGIMIGRGIFGKPWLFENLKNMKSKKFGSKSISMIDKSSDFQLKVMLEHAKLFEKTFLPPHTKSVLPRASQGIKSFDVMKKHFKAYVSGWDGAKELRVQLMNSKDFKDVKMVVKEYLKVK